MIEMVLAKLSDDGLNFSDYPEALQHFFTYLARSDLRERIAFQDYYPLSAVGFLRNQCRSSIQSMWKTTCRSCTPAAKLTRLWMQHWMQATQYRCRASCAYESRRPCATGKGLRLLLPGVRTP